MKCLGVNVDCIVPNMNCLGLNVKCLGANVDCIVPKINCLGLNVKCLGANVDCTITYCSKYELSWAKKLCELS